MVSTRFKRIFLIRFGAYLLSFVGFFALIFQFGPLISTESSYRIDQIFGQTYAIDPDVQFLTSSPVPITSGGQASSQPTTSQNPSGLGRLPKSNSKVIKPASTDYGIVIEKINANAKVIANVDPANERAYTQALSVGVAEAIGSTKPGENGNLFIFSHSADAPWNIVRFNAVFYLLRELTSGDRIIIFYQGRRYDYKVFDKTIISPKDTRFLTNRYDKPVLTLQTCDPPGTLNNRLIVLAQLVGS